MTSNFSIKKIISFIKSELKDLYPDNEIDSFIYLIFEELFNFSRTKLLISQDIIISEDSYQNILNIIRELKTNKPIQYILGKTYFYDLTFNVTSGILIPRQETEELVDWIVKDNFNTQKKILDIGTGSGCIAISLAKNLPGSSIFASDISNEALKITRQNSKLNNVDIQIIKLDILNDNDQTNDMFDIIVSNPPYITEKEKKMMQKNVLDFEPELALFVPDNNPLLFYRAIMEFGLIHLYPGGEIYFEINEAYGQDTALLLEEKNYQDIILKKDINGKDRMLKAVLK